MTPEQLVSAVRARLDETERVALAVSTGPHKPERWTAARYKDDLRGWRIDGQFSCVVDSAFGPDAEHIALHDPAAVLRRVAADRETLDEHSPHRRGACPVCWRVTARSSMREDYPCPTLRALARGLGIDPEETP